MKAFIALLLIASLLINVVNFLQIQQLQGQVAALQTRVQKAETKETTLDTMMGKALPLLAQAKAAIQSADYQKARTLIAEATRRANQMSKEVGTKAAPAATWLRDQVQTLEGQLKQP